MNSTSEYWDVCYESGKDFRFLKHQTVTRLLKYCVQDIKHRTCLDIGCGTGQLTRELTHRGYSCTGVDVSQKAIHIAQSLTVSDQLRYMCLDIERSDLRSLRQYDLITCKYVYAFIADKPDFLRCFRPSKPSPSMVRHASCAYAVKRFIRCGDGRAVGSLISGEYATTTKV